VLQTTERDEQAGGESAACIQRKRIRLRSWKWITLQQRLTILWLAAALSGCAALSPRHGWEDRLQGDAIVLLGEVHDNIQHHRQRLAILRRAFNAGWRPTIAMEQFDRERQADIDRARREKPHDAQHVINLAGLSSGISGGPGNNWQWEYYRPFVQLALQYDVPLIAANLSGADTRKVVRDGFRAVFDAGSLRTLRLSLSIPPDMQVAQEHAVNVGHCNALPPKMVPAMARGQLARDAVMASIVGRHAMQGIVLIAGNGHVRRDIGIPRWLAAPQLPRTWVVGFLEHGNASAPETAFDAMVRTAAAERPDPCVEFRKRMKLS
jgi:uncharacterized iron-regulated protein